LTISEDRVIFKLSKNILFVIVFLSSVSVALSSCTRNEEDLPATKTFTGPTMGTTYTVKIAGRQVNTDKIKEKVDNLLARINDQMSTYIPSSNLSRFNAHRVTTWEKFPAEALFLIKEAKKISKITQGAFDITVGPLVNLWGFGPIKKENSDEIPSDEDIEKILKTVGYENVKTRNHPPGLRKTQPTLYIDLSAIAKGYAVDQIGSLLYSYGFHNFMVEIGGEVVVKGERAKGFEWRIAIEKPEPGAASGGVKEKGVHRVLKLKNKGLATSGDYRNYFVKDGKRYSHTIDPRTGRPITHSLASVTVIDKNCMRADALATALMVLGPEEGFRMAQRLKLAALFIVKSDTEKGFEEKQTTVFKQEFGEG